MIQQEEASQSGARASNIIRHALADRLFHWITAISVLTLIVTAFFPIIGIKFPWVTIHWATGLVLTAAVLFHIIRVFIRKRFKTIWLGTRDLKDAVASIAWLLKIKTVKPSKPGKYSPAQKLMHCAVTVLILATIVTGLLMMVKIDTPFWKRDPYWLSSETWGIIYILHDLAALSLVTVVMIHIYFALRPEKLFYTRSMIKGWITRDEFTNEHDAQRWRPDNE